MGYYKSYRAARYAIQYNDLVAHKNNLIHRDIKPQNNSDKRWCCKITDFGIAKLLMKIAQKL